MLRTTLILMGSILIVMGWQYNVLYSYYNQLMQEREMIIEQQHLPQTRIAVQSVKTALLKKEELQYRIRSKIRLLQNFPFEELNLSSATKQAPVVLIPGSSPSDPNRILIGGVDGDLKRERIEEIRIKEKTMEVVFAVSHDKRAEQIRDFMKKEFTIDSITAKNRRVSVKVRL
ncbi:MAG: hypothetical protein K6347_08305 [Campylobacterales bacterium]